MIFPNQNEIIHTVDELLYQINSCEDYMNAYLVVRKASLTEYCNYLTIANDFFAITWPALINCAIVEISKFYDCNNKESVSFPNLFFGLRKAMNTCEAFNENTVLCEIIQNGVEFLNRQDVQAIREKLRLRRNKHYMHNDIQYFFDSAKLSEDVPFTFVDLELLLYGAKTSCLSLFSCLTKKEWVPNIHQIRVQERPRNPQDLFNLLDMCKRDESGSH